MRIQHTVNPLITEDAEAQDVIFGLSAASSKAVLSGFASAKSGVEDLADGVPFTVPMSGGPDTVNGFFLSGSYDFNLNINGLGDIQVRRGLTGDSSAPNFTAAKVLMEANASSLIVTPVGGACRLHWAVWGDAA